MTNPTPGFAELEQAVAKTGLWDDGRRHGSHRFLLSPDVYQLTPEHVAELDELSRAVHRCLLGVSRLIGIAGDSSLHAGPSSPYNWLYQVLTRGAPYRLSTLRPSNIPLVCKADLMIDESGGFKIAELDATNPRSWGYSIVGRRLAAVIQPGATMLPGVVPYVAQFLNAKKVTEVCFLYGDTQRFYRPELEIAAREMASHGIVMTVIDETEITTHPDRLVDSRTGQDLPKWFIDLPPMNRNKWLIDWLVAAARERRVEFVIPPKQFLASKATLAILSNPDGDEALERLLLTQIKQCDLDLLRRYLPPTRLVSSSSDQKLIRSLMATRPHMLKESVSSGAKGVVFGHEADFERSLERALRQKGGYVLQEMVLGAHHRMSTFGEGGELSTYDDWQLRLTAYFTRTGVQDVAITACRGPRVHGGTDSIITGTIIA